MHVCFNSKNGCEEELHVKKLESHEKYCIFQNVQCPVIKCDESIIFKDAQKHLDETHECLKDDDILEFVGTKEEMIENVYCLSSYGQQFFVQFQMYEKKCEGIWECRRQHEKGKCGECFGCRNEFPYCHRYPDHGSCDHTSKENLIFLRIAMLGHQEDAHSFQATFTYFHENGKKFAIEVDVLPITSGKEEFDSFTAIPMKKLLNYYDAKAGEYKNQLIQFTLKITNEKLDEIEKDKNASVELKLEDSDFDELFEATQIDIQER